MRLASASRGDSGIRRAEPVLAKGGSITHTRGRYDGQSLPNHRQARAVRQQRVARQQQDPAPLAAEPARAPLLGAEREALGEAARVHPGAAHHRQERHRDRARGTARARREDLKETPPWHPSATRFASYPAPTPATSTPPTRTRRPRRTSWKSGNTTRWCAST